MIGLNNLKPAPGSRHRRKIIGRGEGSGHGGSATMGMKGQKAKSGDGVMVGFEGGQMPLVRRIPKRGFTSKFRKEYAVVNVSEIEECFETNSEITPEILRREKIVKVSLPIKILGTGDIKKIFKIKANAFSKSAIEKIRKSGGTSEIVKYVK
jgi:large subunit ribosomal protein L15